MHSESPTTADRPQWWYLRSWETSVCRLRRMSSVLGSGARQYGEGVSRGVDGIVYLLGARGDAMRSVVTMFGRSGVCWCGLGC
jgi:hypothetical protein